MTTSCKLLQLAHLSVRRQLCRRRRRSRRKKEEKDIGDAVAYMDMYRLSFQPHHQQATWLEPCSPMWTKLKPKPRPSRGLGA